MSNTRGSFCETAQIAHSGHFLHRRTGSTAHRATPVLAVSPCDSGER